MATNRTFTMIKPDAVANGHAGKILDQIIQAGFKVVALKYTQLSEERAGDFYGIHRERPFFNDLVSFMTSGPIYAAILEKDNAIEDFRKLIGATVLRRPMQVPSATCSPRASMPMPFTVATAMRTPRSKATSFSVPTSVSN